MVDGKRVIGVIPARGGSKTIAKKNIRNLGGKPLILWSLEVARKVAEIDRVIVSTDDQEIAAIAAAGGAEIYDRPPHLASDEALIIDALIDLRNRLRAEGETAEIMVLLEPTCPLRSAGDVQKCVEMLVREGLDSVATFRAAELNPHRAWKILEGRPEVFIPQAVPWLPRQKQPDAFQLNGAVYSFVMDLLEPGSKAVLFGKAGAVLMPRHRSIDIDDSMDFEIAEILMQRGLNEQRDI
jgi:N-acylneuraminate cytidylyltransferase